MGSDHKSSFVLDRIDGPFQFNDNSVQTCGININASATQTQSNTVFFFKTPRANIQHPFLINLLAFRYWSNACDVLIANHLLGCNIEICILPLVGIFQNNSLF